MKAELLIIGAGTAGLRTALTAAQNGTRTILVGSGPIAGTCLNNGCIPTKAMLHAADVLRTCTHAKEVGITATAKVDFRKVMDRVRSIVTEGREHSEHAAEHTQNLTYIQGEARFVAPRVVEVNHTRITADHIIIATGTRPMVPPIPGLSDVPYLTNVETVELKKQPKHMIILGGGYIACEYATFFAGLGSKVTMVERAPDILTILDDDLRAPVRASLEALGVRIVTGAATTKVSFSDGNYTLTLSGGELSRTSGDALLVACGRIPNTERLDCERGGVTLDGRGYITVDDRLRSNDPNVYAVGDVNGKDLFAHAAKREGWVVLEQVLLGRKAKRPQNVPWAVFTHPSVAGVGRSEQELKKAGVKFDVLEAPFSRCGKARIIREAVGKVKIIHFGDQILGGFIVGPDADNLIHEIALCMGLGDQGLPLLRDTVHVHPTLAEVYESLAQRKS